jgi:hypothetical protein
MTIGDREHRFTNIAGRGNPRRLKQSDEMHKRRKEEIG